MAQWTNGEANRLPWQETNGLYDEASSSSSYSGGQNGLWQGTNGFDNEASSSSYSGGQNGMWRGANGKAQNRFQPYLDPSVSQRTNGTSLEIQIKAKQDNLNYYLNSLSSLKLDHPNYFVTALNTLRAVQDLDKLLDKIIMLFTPPEKTFETNSMDNGQANGLGARFEHAVRTGDVATINKLAPHM